MDDPSAFATYFISQLAHGDRDSAFHSLIEADHAVIQYLITAYRKERVPAIRADLVEIIWQHRQPETTHFLLDVLSDEAPLVFRCALDGLVALGGREVVALMQARRQSFAQDGSQERAEWIDEALVQLVQKG
jgi:hypothetical protein